MTLREKDRDRHNTLFDIRHLFVPKIDQCLAALIRVHFKSGSDIIFEIFQQLQLIAVKLIGMRDPLDFTQSIPRGCARLISIIHERILLSGWIDTLHIPVEFRPDFGLKPLGVIPV